MKIETHNTDKKMAEAAARTAIKIMNSAIRVKGNVTIIAATGASQFDFLESLT